CFEAALALDPEIILVVLAATPMEAAARALGARVACEIFADRAYNDDATLLDRNRPGAVLHDPAAAGPRIEAMLRTGAIIASGGRHIPCAIDTVCVHGDSPEAVAMAGAIRAHLAGAGIALRRFG
ncbi:MAG: LamB/YcsF family protein, partial [Geminicoccaceae bacterium]|nr:LamB/YcsF family protein [Geminicoccaceae bacterium]